MRSSHQEEGDDDMIDLDPARELVTRSSELCGANRKLLAESQVLIALSRRICNGWLGLRGGALDAPGSAGHEIPHWPLDELERLVRDKIKRGALFVLRDLRYLATPASGRPCKVCSQAISTGNECEVRAPRGYAYAHMVCHRLWLRESEAFLRQESAAEDG